MPTQPKGGGKSYFPWTVFRSRKFDKDDENSRHEYTAKRDSPTTPDGSICDGARGHNPPWLATWRRVGPLTGLLGLVLAIASISVSFVILAISDKKPVDEWTFQPSTYLAIASAVANQAMRYSALQGFVIAWWTSALRGSTIGELHRDWSMGNSFWNSVIAGRYSNIFSTASLLSTLVAVDGPLLQRATNVTFASFTNPISLNVTIVPEVPSGFSGIWTKAGESNTPPAFAGRSLQFLFGQDNIMSSIGVSWEDAVAVNASIDGCKGTCRAKIQAPMLAKTDCHNYTVPFQPAVDNEHAYGSAGHWLFYVEFQMLPGEMGEAINYTVLYRESEGCELGHVVRKNCLLRSAIGIYAVNINGSAVERSASTEVELVALANNTAFVGDLNNVNSAEHRSTLAGVATQAGAMYNTNVLGVNDSGIAVGFNGMSGFSQRFIKTIPNSIWETCTHFERTLVNNAYVDPTDYIMNGLNDLMFRVGFAASRLDYGVSDSNKVPTSSLVDNGISFSQDVSGEQFGQHNVYQTNYWYFLAAAIVELLCVSCVLTTYWGWWRLGREVSFSPLEIAKAFEAPLLTDAYSNSSGNDIARNAGDMPIRYGATGIPSDQMPDYEAKKLAFADPNLVYRPLDSFRFET